MNQYQAEVQNEITNENLYADWETAIEEENRELALKIEAELIDRGVDMSPYRFGLSRHTKAVIYA